MTTLFVHHPASLEHRVPAGHPERPDRIRAIHRALAGAEFDGLARRLAPPGTLDLAALAHPRDFVDAIVAASPENGLVGLDAETILSPGTVAAALLSLGGAAEAVDAVMRRDAANAFVATRPPGHHAEASRAMGFCIFNTAIVAARHARRAHGAERVALVDFDVHHGNGTQDIAWSDPTLLYASTHQMPLYPGTGSPGERGDHDTIVNVPLRAGAEGAAFREAVATRILPRLQRFAPDLVVVSAGFDAHRDDPLGGLALDESDFAWVTEELMQVADRHCGGRLVSVLEGGYDLAALGGSVAAHLRTLMSA